jgi:hypothetical protein
MGDRLSASLGAPDFSLVLGGPLYQIFRRANLSGSALELLRRRILVIAAIAWVPLLLLSAFAGHVEGGVSVPFLHDVEAHVRFLIALPLLIGAELLVHVQMRPIVNQFVERGIVVDRELPKFEEAVRSTIRLRNSVVGEVALLVLVYTLGFWVWRHQIALDTATWYAIPDGDGTQLTPAGYWYVLVSLPVFQFILLRWYLRFFLWFSFLWRVSRLDLRLVSFHPDRAAGLGFLARSMQAFVPVLIAQGAALAGLFASQILYAEHSLLDYKVEAASFLGFFVVVTVSPLLVFTPQLARVKRAGLAAFGALASRYAAGFEDKWMRGGAPVDEALLGSADIQSLADLGNSYSVVTEMRLVPFGLKDVVALALAAAAPFIPLLLTVFSLEEIATRAMKVLF